MLLSQKTSNQWDNIDPKTASIAAENAAEQYLNSLVSKKVVKINNHELDYSPMTPKP